MSTHCESEPTGGGRVGACHLCLTNASKPRWKPRERSLFPRVPATHEQHRHVFRAHFSRRAHRCADRRRRSAARCRTVARAVRPASGQRRALERASRSPHGVPNNAPAPDAARSRRGAGRAWRLRGDRSAPPRAPRDSHPRRQPRCVRRRAWRQRHGRPPTEPELRPRRDGQFRDAVPPHVGARHGSQDVHGRGVHGRLRRSSAAPSTTRRSSTAGTTAGQARRWPASRTPRTAGATQA